MGRGPKGALLSDGDLTAELSDMMTLLHSSMFIDQGIKLKWIKERITR